MMTYDEACWALTGARIALREAAAAAYAADAECDAAERDEDGMIRDRELVARRAAAWEAYRRLRDQVDEIARERSLRLYQMRTAGME